MRGLARLCLFGILAMSVVGFVRSTLQIAHNPLLRPEAIKPLASVAQDLGRINSRLDTTRTLHLLRHIDGPDDARRIQGYRVWKSRAEI